jgi:PAS domain S-box-containing protein
MEKLQTESFKILDILKNSPHGMSVTEIARIINKNKHSVGRYLEVLQVSGQVEMRMFGKAKVFSAANRIPLDLLMNFSREFILILDSDNRVLHVNNYFLNLIKTTREAILGKNFYYISVSPHPSQTILDSIQTGIKAGISETEIIVENGTQKIYLMRIRSIVFTEGTKGIAISIEDITDRKNVRLLEQKYNYLLDIISDTASLGILISRNDRVIFANKSMENLFGLTCQETPLFYLMENIVPEDRERINKIFLEHSVELRKSSKITFSLVGVSGKINVVKGSIASFKEPKGISCFLLITDGL